MSLTSIKLSSSDVVASISSCAASRPKATEITLTPDLHRDSADNLTSSRRLSDRLSITRTNTLLAFGRGEASKILSALFSVSFRLAPTERCVCCRIPLSCSSFTGRVKVSLTAGVDPNTTKLY